MPVIPKVIHQTWKDQNVPKKFQPLMDTWKKFHPDWQFKLWTDDMNREFIRENYPHFLTKFDSFPRHIQRVDAIRYFILRKEGGVYVDLDIECLKEITILLHNKTFVVGQEPKEHCIRFSRDLILCNAFMAAIPEHRFLEYTCDKMYRHPDLHQANTLDVLESTGPFLLTSSYLSYSRQNEVTVLDSNAIYPLTIHETRMLVEDLEQDAAAALETKIAQAYALHYFCGTWWS